jgi:Fic family protein
MVDNNLVKKVMTFKSGPFHFTAAHSPSLTKLMSEEDILYKAMAEIPILPEAASRLEEEVIIKSIFGTAAIEGNPLTEERVAQLLAAPGGQARMRRAEREILNLKEAYAHIRENKAADGGYPLSEDAVKRLHRLITQGIDYKDNTPGAYRNEPVRVGDQAHGGVHVPPKNLADIRPLMGVFCSWMNSREIMELPVKSRAVLAHYHLAVIHPFGNGNGRTARALEGLVLASGGVRYLPAAMSNFYYRNIDDYYRAFSDTLGHPRHEITSFLEFAYRGMIESLRDIREKIGQAVRRLTVRQHCHDLRRRKKLTQRQHDLLTLLLEQGRPFTLGDLMARDPFVVLYRRVSERTARRDLKKLEEMGLLAGGNGSYRLNLRLLG